MQLNDAGQVELKLKTPWRDGTTHLVMSPLEFLQRLAALVPRPRLHLIRFHGVLAPNAKLRSLVVPQGPPKDEQAAGVAASGVKCEAETAQGGPARISWARLLKRVFDIDMQFCPNCGAGELKIIAAILERPVIEKILAHLGLDPQPPPKGRVREGGAARCVGTPWPTSGSTLRPKSNPARRERSKACQLASPEPADAQTCVPRPTSGSAARLYRLILGPTDGV
ncbi:MAG: transposase [Burkholderiaceae bacterium]